MRPLIPFFFVLSSLLRRFSPKVPDLYPPALLLPLLLLPLLLLLFFSFLDSRQGSCRLARGPGLQLEAVDKRALCPGRSPSKPPSAHTSACESKLHALQPPTGTPQRAIQVLFWGPRKVGGFLESFREMQTWRGRWGPPLEAPGRISRGVPRRRETARHRTARQRGVPLRVRSTSSRNMGARPSYTHSKGSYRNFRSLRTTCSPEPSQCRLHRTNWNPLL